MWIFKKYALFYIVDVSLHDNDVWITITKVPMSYCYLLTVKHLLSIFAKYIIYIISLHKVKRPINTI